MKKFDMAALQEREISREEIKEGLLYELKSTFRFLSDVINSPTVVDAMTEVYWQRVQDLKAKNAMAPELPLDGKEANHGV